MKNLLHRRGDGVALPPRIADLNRPQPNLGWLHTLVTVAAIVAAIIGALAL